MASNIEKVQEALHGRADGDVLQAYDDTLVPPSGPADTVAGEITRAMMRLLYRDWNDGDRFFSGYGWETCMPSAAYLMEIIGGSVEDSLHDIADMALEDDDYTRALNNVKKEVEEYLQDNPELADTENTDDSREWPTDRYEDMKETYSYDFELPWQIQDLLREGKVDGGDIRWELESWEYFQNAEIWVYETYVEVEGLSEEQYNDLQYGLDNALDDWGRDWAEEYDLDDEDEDEDYEEE